MRRESMAAYKPTIKAPSKYGDIIFSALVKLAALITLFLLGGIIISLIVASWPSIEKFGLLSLDQSGIHRLSSSGH